MVSTFLEWCLLRVFVCKDHFISSGLDNRGHAFLVCLFVYLIQLRQKALCRPRHVRSLIHVFGISVALLQKLQLAYHAISDKRMSLSKNDDTNVITRH